MKKTISHPNDQSYSETRSVRYELLAKNNNQSSKDGVNIELRSVNQQYHNQSSFYVQSKNAKKKKTTSRISTLRSPSLVRISELNRSENGKKTDQINRTEGSGDSNYDIWDLTYTLITTKIPITIVGFLFIIFTTIRYYTFACLIYISTQSNDTHILWVLVIVGDRLIYMILVIKISLQRPETKTQIVLKSHWNSKQSDISELFQVTDTKKLIISIIRGLIPAQLAFVYIKAQPRKKFQLYTAINYISASIETVIYYPFFIVYCFILKVDDTFGINAYYKNATIGLALIGQIIISIVTIILLLIGVRRKYGKLLCC